MRKRIVAIVLIMVVLFMQSTPVFAFEKVDFVELDGEITASDYLTMIGYYSKIPLTIRENYQLSGWKIILTDQEIEESYYPQFSHMKICAVFDSGAKSIYLENKSNGWRAVVHEIGHYIDSGYAYPYQYSEEEEWKKIWLANQLSNNKQEDFADAFSDYILKPDKMKKASLETYEYVKKIVDVWEELKE